MKLKWIELNFYLKRKKNMVLIRVGASPRTKGTPLSIDIPSQCARQNRFVRLRSAGETVFDGVSQYLIIYSCCGANRMICLISTSDWAGKKKRKEKAPK